MANFIKMSIIQKLILIFFIVLSPSLVNAQSLILESVETKYQAGDYFQINLSVDAENQAINAISGIIKIPNDKLEIINTKYGNSIVSLWA